MAIEDQELVNLNAHVTSLEQQIAFRPKGKAGKLRDALATAKRKRDTRLSYINRRSGDLTETNALIEYALEVQEKTEVLKKDIEEQSEKLEAQFLYLSYLENNKPRKVFAKISLLRPDFSEIGIRMKEERNLEGALEKAQFAFDSAKQKSEKRSPVGTGNRTVQLTRAYNNLKMAKFDIAHLPIVIDFYELRAEEEWCKTVIEELRERIIEIQAYEDELKSEKALMEKYGFKT